MEKIVAWLLFIIVGSTVAYLFIANVMIPIIKTVKENARLK